MNDLIYSVRYIFKNYLQKQHCSFFNIPEYQRGYKWTADNVMQLLDDLKNFGNKRNGDEFYCLQNITVAKETLKDSTCMNVIDGQQRLLSILGFLRESYKDENGNEQLSNKHGFNFLLNSVLFPTNLLLRFNSLLISRSNA